MFVFSSDNGVSLLYNGKKLLTGLSPWMSSTLNGGDKILLKPVMVNDACATFADEDGVAHITVSVNSDEGKFAIYLKGEYRPTTAKHGSHLQDDMGVGLDFDIYGAKRYVDAFMQGTFWQKPFFGTKLKNIKPRTQMLLVERSKDKLYLMATCHKQYKTEMFPSKKAMGVVAHSNTVLDDIDECVLIGGIGNDEYVLPEAVTAYGLNVMEKSGSLRKNKKYPEVFEYLGWCSWDAFHMDVTHDDLLKKCREFKEKNIPVKWMIIDDMWGDVTAIDRTTMHQRELNDWEADPVRFPQGLKGAIKAIKDEYGLLVGMWHPTNGYWSGIDPNGALAKRHGDLLEYVIGATLFRYTPVYMHSFQKGKIDKYYDLQHKFYKECGADFTKVDNQGSTERFSYRKGDINTTSLRLHGAIEKAAGKYYNNNLINCMGMPIENFWNRGKNSNINRFSGDFQPENRKWFVQHLLMCSYNELTQGTVYTGDWDMWWSDDQQAKKNAVLRAMSGGPIYMSDELGRSIRDVIMPTVLSDGRILRLNDPALPTRDCLFANAEESGKIFKVFNRIKDGGVVAAFNLDEEERPVCGVITPSDVEGLSDGKYVVYDWFNGTAQIMDKSDSTELTLNNYDDFRLILFARIKGGKAVIGLKEKYMAGAAVEYKKGCITALDDGTLLVFDAKNQPEGFQKSGILYEKAVKKGEKVIF